MELINQPFNGQLGNRLIELMNSQDYHTINIVVAFAKNSGVLRIKDALEKFREQGGIVNIYVGIDMKVTSHDALVNLFINSDSLTIIHAEKEQSFHSKIYQFLGNENDVLVVGSNNLTGGGLWTNFESSIIITSNDVMGNRQAILQYTESYFNYLHSLNNLLMPIDSIMDLDLLLESSYILKEVEEKINEQIIKKEKHVQEKLFGDSYETTLPRIKKAVKQVDLADNNLIVEPVLSNLNGIDKTIWFQTKAMTGGSSNQLDLSKQSTIERGDYKNTSFDFGNEKLIKGAVEFFDLDAFNTNQTKDITINFDGIDYIGNTILYFQGEKANGTWRLEIKGESVTHTKITKTFKEKNHNKLGYLKNKIITFTKVNSDYYYMTVFPETELEKFKEYSTIVALNGSKRSNNSRYMGIV